uniref:ABC1 domain-containing protein n=1 Tax=Caenorhabditis tropicalis TaxID=1561998 RepID=A0A1I7TEL4_9PELO
MAGKRPPASTIKWCQQELGPICEGITMAVRSQVGYDGRRIEKQIRRKALKTIVMGGQEVDPLNEPNKTNDSLLSTTLPNTNDALQRARVVAAGIETFAKLMSQGIYPGSAGFTVTETGERKFMKQSSPIQSTIAANLLSVAEKVSKGAITLAPFPLPTLTKLGTWAITNPRAELPIPPQIRAALPAITQIEALIQSALGATEPLEVSRKVVTQPRKLKLEGVTDQDTGKETLHPNTIASEPIDKTLTKEEADFLIKAAKSVEDDNAETAIYGDKKQKPDVYRPELPKNFELNLDMGNTHTLTRSNESSVPASRIGRLATFGQLAFGLLGGATAEVRGAALKLGQMLSIQDSSTVPPALLQIFERVRQSADFMPLKQVHNQMRDAFGNDWRDKFEQFDDKPFACASIGQVHKAQLKDGRVVAVKVQYPGVAEGIDSDIDNLVSILSVGGIFPKGMFLDAFVGVARRELKQECDYEREARAMRKFRELIADWNDAYVPEVIDELSSSRVLTTELVYGKPVDACVEESQVVRDYIAGKFIELCLKEIFVWRFMQTDPNWSNFFLGKHPKTGEPRLVLLDFGASRAYGKKFVDIYMNIIRAAYDGDKKKIIEFSREIGFLTGYETTVMEDAHVESVMIMGETLASNHPYDFANQDVTKRIQKLIPVMLEHRLTSPPEEIYSLHRKLSGCYLLAAKLKATVSCGGLFHEIHDNYVYGEDGKDINID